MNEANLILTLAKVIIATAWADGEVSHEEVNSLKDLLFRLPAITGREWAMLEMYIDAPVGASERARLVEQLQGELRSTGDKKFALQALEDLIHADGVVSVSENQIFNEIKAAIESVDVGILGGLSRLVNGALQRRTQATLNAPNREIHFEDFIKNKVFYAVQRRLKSAKTQLDIPEKDLRKLSLAGGLMAKVAHVDLTLTSDEYKIMVDTLQKTWGISQEGASFVAEVAISEVSADLDYYRLTRGFFETTSGVERLAFLDILFSVADADGLVSNEEIEEIRTIANSLKMTHKQFIDAKLKIPRDRRET